MPENEHTFREFQAAFEQGAVFRLDGEEAVVSVSVLGHVDLPTGRAEAVDPMTYSVDPGDAGRQYAPDVAPGRYRVELSDAEGPVAARLVFTDAPTMRWEPLDYSVSVDSGTIAFCDADALQRLSSMDQDDLLDAVARVGFGGEFRVGRRGLGGLKFGGLRVVVFSTGGDGGFPCYWGLDREGTKTSLLVDMGGLCHWREHGVKIAAFELQTPGAVTHGELEDAGISIEVERCDDKTIFLKVDGYDGTKTWELRTAEGKRLNHSKLYQRDRGILRLTAPKGLPEDAFLFVNTRSEFVPMVPTGEHRG